MFRLKTFLDKIAFFKGLTDFKKGKLTPPNYVDMSLKEWHRGQNYAYFQNLEQLKKRNEKARYRNN